MWCLHEHLSSGVDTDFTSQTKELIMSEPALPAQQARYQAVFFDLYGTLLDIRTDEDSQAAWQALHKQLQDFGATYESVDVLRTRFAQFEAGEKQHQASHAVVPEDLIEFDLLPVYRLLLADWINKVEQIMPLPQAAAQAAWAFRQGATSMIRLYPGALDAIRRLRQAGVIVTLLSNAQACYTRPELEITGLANAFDHVIISSDEGMCKPARDLYALALKRAHTTTQQSLMVGNDETNDIIGAASAGIDGAYLHTEISPAHDPATSRHAVCSFTGADYEGLLDYVLNT